MTREIFQSTEKVWNMNAEKEGRVCLTTLASISFVLPRVDSGVLKGSAPKTPIKKIPPIARQLQKGKCI